MPFNYFAFALAHFLQKETDIAATKMIKKARVKSSENRKNYYHRTEVTLMEKTKTQETNK